MTQKVTYTSTDVDLEAFHQEFDSALTRVRGRPAPTIPTGLGAKRWPHLEPPSSM